METKSAYGYSFLMTCISMLMVGFFCASVNAETYKAHVNGMVCAFCAQGIDKTLRALPQTKDVYVSIKKRIVIIETKENTSLASDKISALINDAGYSVASVEIVSGTVQQIKSDMEKL